MFDPCFRSSNDGNSFLAHRKSSSISHYSPTSTGQAVLGSRIFHYPQPVGSLGGPEAIRYLNHPPPTQPSSIPSVALYHRSSNPSTSQLYRDASLHVILYFN